MDEKERYPRTYLYDYGALISSVVLSIPLLTSSMYIALAMPEFTAAVYVFAAVITWTVFEVLRIGIVAHVLKVKQFLSEANNGN